MAHQRDNRPERNKDKGLTRSRNLGIISSWENVPTCRVG